MVRAFLTSLLLAASLSIGPSGIAGAAEPGTAAIIDEQRVTDRVVELTIDTPAFTAPTKVHVILPTGYDSRPSRRWPVSYFTAGTQNRYNSFVDGLDGDDLTAEFPSIIVSPDANSGYWSDWYNAGAFGPPKYETYVIDQLIPLIDGRFRTLADRSHRAIAGISMGGYGAMMLAARHPDLFAAAATLSGAVDSNIPLNGTVLSISSTLDGAEIDAIYGPRATQEVRWRGHNPWDLAGNLDGLRLFVLSANGTRDPELGEPDDVLSCAVEKGVYNASVSLHERFEALGITHDWRDYGPGCHSRQNFQREVLDGIDDLAAVFADPPARPETFDYRSIEAEFDVWGWDVATDPSRALEFLRLRTTDRGARLTGSGLTTVTTPPRYRGLEKVDVNGKATKPLSDGRLRFSVDLGPANTVQQYTPGSESAFQTREIRLEPHAAIRITRVEKVAGGVMVCARALGGSIPKARFRAGRKGITVTLGRREVCRTIRGGARISGVAVTGRDRFGHPARATAK